MSFNQKRSDALDLAGRDFWEGFWTNPAGRSFRGVSYFFHAFSSVLKKWAPEGTTVLEAGCGGSVWLPVLARHGVDAWGIDYSDVGVEIVRRNLSSRDAKATVVKGDLFDRSALPQRRFDVVFSLGLIEHFADSRPLVERFAELCRPGGIVITLVPNFGGLWGAVQKSVDREFYDAHQIFDPRTLDRAHTASGFDVVAAGCYFGGISPLVVNYSKMLGRWPSIVARPAFAATWAAQQLLCWATAPLPRAISNPPALAAHIIGVYKAP